MFTIEPMTGVLGAEISGIDLGALDDPQVAKLNEAFLDHKVLVFRDQHSMTPDSQIAFARRFGEILSHDYLPHLPDHPEVTVIADDGTAPAKETWHSDVSYEEMPALGSILRAVEIPDYGRDTMFADMEAVYTSFSSTLQAVLDGLTALHSAGPVFGDRHAVRPAVEHPVIRTHPVTGRKSLYVNHGFTTEILGLQPSESRAMLRMLYDAVLLPDVQCRVRWRPGTVTMWDNRTVQHAIVHDREFPRVMHRVTIKGDRPR